MEAKDNSHTNQRVGLIDRLSYGLDRLDLGGNRRKLPELSGLEDFCSNDYLGLARMPECEQIDLSVSVGATGSRLISGNSDTHEHMEAYLAHFHHGESALIFNSGYAANVGVLSCLMSRSDTIIYDKLCHASIRDGLRLSLARSVSFRHNDLRDLEQKLKSARGSVLVVVESLYSMDGDFAPLDEILDLSEAYGAEVMVDEAHTTGIYGPGGAGYMVALERPNDALIRIHTWGKALGNHGACVVGPSVVKNWLINKSRPFIYTTALSPAHVAGALRAYQRIKAADDKREALFAASAYAYSLLERAFGSKIIGDPESPILGVMVPGNRNVVTVADACRAAGFAIVGIRCPTVPEGTERIRICVHAYNSFESIKSLVKILDQTIS